MKWDCSLRSVRRVLLVFSICFYSLSNGQIVENVGFGEWTSELGKTNRSILTAFGSANYGSSAIDNVFAGRIGFGGHIESDRIADIYGEMNATDNSARVDLSYGVMYWAADSIHKRKWNLYGGISRRYYGQSSFNNDVFGLLFRGNKPYAGNTIDLSNTDATIMEYAKYSIGGYKRISPNSNKDSYILFGGSLSYLQGLDYLNFTTDNGSLFTEENGQYVDLTLQYELSRSSRPKGIAETKGGGMGLDLFYARDKGEKYYYAINVSDLGFIKFKDLNTYIKDTADVHFEGHRIVQNGGTLGQILDSIVGIVDAKGSSSEETVLTPATFSVRVGKHLKEGLDADLLIQHVFTPNNLPFLKGRITKSKSDYSFGMSLGLLAMEKGVIIGFHGSKRWRDRLLLQAHVAGLESYLMPSILQGLQVSMGFGVLLD